MTFVLPTDQREGTTNMRVTIKISLVQAFDLCDLLLEYIERPEEDQQVVEVSSIRPIWEHLHRALLQVGNKDIDHDLKVGQSLDHQDGTEDTITRTA